MEHSYYAQSERILIRPLNARDIGILREWRNNEKLSRFLGVIPYITPEMQISWYEKYLKDNDTIFFAVVDKTRNALVGSVALYKDLRKNKRIRSGIALSLKNRKRRL